MFISIFFYKKIIIYKNIAKKCEMDDLGILINLKFWSILEQFNDIIVITVRGLKYVIK